MKRLDVPALLIASRGDRDPDECWPWAGSVNSVTGYGTAGTQGYAHRLAWEAEHGPIPEKLTIDHVDHDFAGRSCVNALRHMELVTRTENAMRGNSPIAQNARKTECPEGHQLVGDNLIVRQRPGRGPTRECRACKRANETRRYHARRRRL